MSQPYLDSTTSSICNFFHWGNSTLYSYPESYKNQVIQAKNAHPSVPIIAIVNPDSGQGSSVDLTYVISIQQTTICGNYCIGLCVYWHGSRSTSSVEADVNTYHNWYSVNEIFFNEMSNVSGYESHYSTLTQYVKSHGMTMTIGNPGTDTLSSYVGTVDNLVISENLGLPTLADLAGWHTSYAQSNFSMIAFGVGLPTQIYVTSTTSYVGYI